MLKKLVIFTLFGLCLAGLSAELAQTAPGNYGLDSTAENAKYKDTDVLAGKNDLYVKINRVVSGFLGVMAFLFFGLLSYAGVRWMTARGNEEFVTTAKESMEAAVIGLIVVMAAYAITTFIFDRISSDVPAYEVSCPSILNKVDCENISCVWDAVANNCHLYP